MRKYLPLLGDTGSALILKEAPMQTQLPLKEMTIGELRTLIDAIKKELEEREWHKIIANLRAMDQIVELARQAREEYAAGLSEEGW
jgi:hypothetical protein